MLLQFFCTFESGLQCNVGKLDGTHAEWFCVNKNNNVQQLCDVRYNDAILSLVFFSFGGNPASLRLHPA